MRTDVIEKSFEALANSNLFNDDTIYAEIITPSEFDHYMRELLFKLKYLAKKYDIFTSAIDEEFFAGLLTTDSFYFKDEHWIYRLQIVVKEVYNYIDDPEWLLYTFFEISLYLRTYFKYYEMVT